MTDALSCQECGEPLTYRGGRRPRYCSSRCKKRAQRARESAQRRAEALERVELAKARLRRVQALRASLDAEPDPLDPPHRFATFGSPAEMRAGAALSPGIDTEAAAQVIRERFNKPPQPG